MSDELRKICNFINMEICRAKYDYMLKRENLKIVLGKEYAIRMMEESECFAKEADCIGSYDGPYGTYYGVMTEVDFENPRKCEVWYRLGEFVNEDA